jgi:type II secretory pathway pseudopilin PulG
LAEVLIALVVIGIIAAITVPTIISNYQEKAKVAKIKKVYATLSNALTRVKADGGDMDFEIGENTTEIRNWYNTYLKKYLVTTKVCYNQKGCWNSGDTKALSGNIATFNQNGIGIGWNVVTAILNDGTFINVDAYGKADTNNRLGINTTANNTLAILFDINGNKKPNTIGKDIFVTVFTENGFVPAYKDRTEAQIDANCSSSGTGYSCIQKYLKEF